MEEAGEGGGEEGGGRGEDHDEDDVDEEDERYLKTMQRKTTRIKQKEKKI